MCAQVNPVARATTFPSHSWCWVSSDMAEWQHRCGGVRSGAVAVVMEARGNESREGRDMKKQAIGWAMANIPESNFCQFDSTPLPAQSGRQ